MKKFQLLAAAMLVAGASVTNSYAQNTLGAACGCPAVSARTITEDITTLYADANGVLTSNLLLTCDKIYTITRKLYVPNGRTITIMPGTVVKGVYDANVANAAALIVSVGGKIIADGTASCPIVFTSSLDPVNGSHPICARAEWGGIVLLGRATNNLVAGQTYSVADGVGFVEGFSSGNAYNLYGKLQADGTVGANGFWDDNDNSGVMRFVSIRHAGAAIAEANELNGLSLGSVGRGTTIDYIEVIGNDDDGIEFFGGNVNVKHIALWWGNDDNFDWDLGYTGKMQFLFSITSPDRTSGGIPYGDNAFECDGDDNSRQPSLLSDPIVFNATCIGDGLTATESDISGNAAIRAKEATKGKIYNSIFANWNRGLDINNKAARTAGDSYDFWHNDQFQVKNNIFINVTNTLRAGQATPVTVSDVSRVAGSDPDHAKFELENDYLASLAGFSYGFGLNCGTSTITTQFDAIPGSEQSSSIVPPTDGFFTPVSYIGAFGSFEKSWLADWSYGYLTRVTAGLQPCPTDVDLSGGTNTADLNAVLGAFGTSCQK